VAQRTGQKREYISSYPRKQIVQWWHEFAKDNFTERAKIAQNVDPKIQQEKKETRQEALKMWSKDKGD